MNFAILFKELTIKFKQHILFNKAFQNIEHLQIGNIFDHIFML